MENGQFSFRTYAWQQFKKNKPAYYSYCILLVLVFIAILAPVIANDKPLYMHYKGTHLFPVFSLVNKVEVKDPVTGAVEVLQLDITDWKHLDADMVIWPPVTYLPHQTDLLNADYIAPGGEQFFTERNGQTIEIPTRFRHWLGTNKRGEDVLSGLIHGTRISLTIGILSMGIASVLGILLGALAGYCGDTKLSTSRGVFWSTLAGAGLAFYYAFFIRSFQLADALSTSGWAVLLQLAISTFSFIVICALFYYTGRGLGKLPWLNKKVFIPVDSIVSRFIEILISLPRLILIIAIAAIAKPSLINLMIIIGLTSWTEIARFTRAEFLRIQGQEYIQAAKALGLSEWRIIFKHALPNGLAPAFVSIAFGIAAAILIESGLSFLGVGVPADTVTWGSLLFSGYQNYNAWWLVIFPGLAIFMTVTIYNLLGEGLRDALDPKLKR